MRHASTLYFGAFLFALGMTACSPEVHLSSREQRIVASLPTAPAKVLEATLPGCEEVALPSTVTLATYPSASDLIVISTEVGKALCVTTTQSVLRSLDVPLPSPPPREGSSDPSPGDDPIPLAPNPIAQGDDDPISLAPNHATQGDDDPIPLQPGHATRGDDDPIPLDSDDGQKKNDDQPLKKSLPQHLRTTASSATGDSQDPPPTALSQASKLL